MEQDRYWQTIYTFSATKKLINCKIYRQTCTSLKYKNVTVDIDLYHIIILEFFHMWQEKSIFQGSAISVSGKNDP